MSTLLRCIGATAVTTDLRLLVTMPDDMAFSVHVRRCAAAYNQASNVNL